MTKNSTKILNIGSYILLIFFSVVWTDINNLPLWMIAVTTVPLIAADIFSDYNASLLAYIYTHRRGFVFFILGTCILLSGFLYYMYPIHKIYPGMTKEGIFILVIQFILQGAIVGLTLRMLLLNLFADMLRAKDIHKAKFLIMAAWILFLIMAPVNEQHRILSSIFILGFGGGFLFHYLIRVQEKKNALRNRLKENLFNLITELKKEDSENQNHDEQDDIKKVKITIDEIKAIRLYSEQKWNKLTFFLNNHPETNTLFFIKLCMLRKLHSYDAALGLIKEKINIPGIQHKNYYHLHYALNESEKFDHKGNWNHKDLIFEHLEEAYKINPKCLLTCATYALRIAGEIEPIDENTSIEKKKSIQAQKDKAFALIWDALKIYEDKPLRNPIAPATGMTIPVTYTFLLESYGYVLLKCGHTRFAKALILQSLFQDPTFSATYLHLAEWYFDFYGNNKSSKNHSQDTWRKSARLNLQIAIEMEREHDLEKKGTLISISAKKLMAKI